jgi:peptidoglycan hydrolase CwlO-like protein
MKKLTLFVMAAGVLYFATNGVLAVFQEASQRSNQEAYATLETAIGAEREALSALNAQLDAVTQHLNGLQSQLDDLANQITGIENEYKDGNMPDDQVNRHNALVDQHNALVAKANADLHKSQELATQIRASVDAYNHDIENANILARQGMTRSLLMPGLAR